MEKIQKYCHMNLIEIVKMKEPVFTASGYDQDEPGCWKESDERLRYPDVFAKAPKNLEHPEQIVVAE